MASGIIALIGVIIFWLPSPEERPKVYELYLAGVWGLMTISFISTFRNWPSSQWSRKIMSVAASFMALLYLQKYLTV
jgi:hypothetical protein